MQFLASQPFFITNYTGSSVTVLYLGTQKGALIQKTTYIPTFHGILPLSPDPREDLKVDLLVRNPHDYKGYFIGAPLRHLFFGSSQSSGSRYSFRSSTPLPFYFRVPLLVINNEY